MAPGIPADAVDKHCCEQVVVWACLEAERRTAEQGNGAADPKPGLHGLPSQAEHGDPREDASFKPWFNWPG